MATRIGEIATLCRFCLSHQGLMALSKATSLTLAMEDVFHCTGIWISNEETLPYSICNECFKAINTSVCFRRTCLQNDNVVKTLVSILSVSVKKNAEEGETQTNGGSDPTMFTGFHETASSSAVITLDNSDSDDAMSSTNGEFGQRTIRDSGKCLLPVAISEDANIDAPFESVGIDLVSTDTSDSDYSMASLYEEAMAQHSTNVQPKADLSEPHTSSSSTQQTLKQQNAARELCPICGIMVLSMHHHLNRTHNKTNKFSCPHCPVKVREKYNLKNHINTWHVKRIILTCEYCGKGFTNLKSHAYHITNSHGKSDVYECEICHRRLKSYDGYKKHLKEHSVTAIKCPDCGKLYKNNATLEFHQLRYHPSRT